MYLDSIALTRTLPCLAEPGKIIVIGKPNRSLDEVLPYLATLPGLIAYNPDARTLHHQQKLARRSGCVRHVDHRAQYGALPGCAPSTRMAVGSVGSVDTETPVKLVMICSCTRT